MWVVVEHGLEFRARSFGLLSPQPMQALQSRPPSTQVTGLLPNAVLGLTPKQSFFRQKAWPQHGVRLPSLAPLGCLSPQQRQPPPADGRQVRAEWTARSATTPSFNSPASTLRGLPFVSDIPALSAHPPLRKCLCHRAGLSSSYQPAAAQLSSSTAPAPPVREAWRASVAVPSGTPAWRIPAETQLVWLVGLMAAAVISGIVALLAHAIPALRALSAAARAAERLADTAREELPATLAAVRLSGMEISDLTMELSDLSGDISEGVRSSTRAMRAAEDGLKRVGNFAANQTLTLLQERARISSGGVQPVVAQAAANTRTAVAQARRLVKDISSLGSLHRWMKRRAPRRAVDPAALYAAEAAAAARARAERQQ